MNRLALIAGALAIITPAPRALPSGHLADFGVPSTFSVREEGKVTRLPVSYLATYPVKDPSEKLPGNARGKLCRLVAAADKENRKLYKQDYPLETSKPLVQLVLANYGDVRAATGESGRIIFIGDLAKALCAPVGEKR